MAKGKNTPAQKQPPLPENNTIITASTTAYSGPVPHPAILEKLESILPGSANRIMEMAEKDQAAYIETQKANITRLQSAIDKAHRENQTSLWMAFIFCLVCMGMGGALVLLDHEYIGGTLLGTTLVGVASSFLKRQKSLPPIAK